MPLEEERIGYKPFEFPWAYDFWEKQQNIHWLPKEVPLGDDVNDFNNKLTDSERNLVTHIFRFFTQSDIEIANCYHKHYMRRFKPVEIQMMLSSFANMETVHIAAYSHLLETLGLPAVEYSAFLKYEAMRDKFEWLRSFKSNTPMDIAVSLAAFSGATEGMSLFAAFAILLNFPRHGKLRGMGDIISWSVRDESLHCEGIARLFHAYLAEYPNLYEEGLADRISNVFMEAVENEFNFIDLAFEMGPVEGLTKEDMKLYIKYIADIRLQQLGQKKIYNIKANPLSWLSVMLNGAEFGNFFETRPTDYSKAATEGDWNDAYDF